MKHCVFRKICAFSLALITLASTSAALTASAASAPMAAGVSATAVPYRVRTNSDGTVTITKYTGSESTVQVPLSISGKTVTAIDADAFANVRSIKTLFLPKSIKTVSGTAFVGCSNLQTFQVDSRNSYYTAVSGVLFNKNKTELIAYPGGKSGDYTVPDTVSSIESHAFCDCQKLTGVTVPAHVKAIRYNAFAYCTGLKKVTLSEGLMHIGTAAFNGCTNLTQLSLPQSVTIIDNYAFAFCRSLKSMILPKKITALSASLFEGCSALRYVQIPSGITKVYSNAFGHCTSLISIRLPKTVQNIYGLAFCACHNLKNLTILSTNAQMQPIAFDDCPNLTIYGQKGSTAEAAAKQGNLRFSTGKAPALSLSTITVKKRVVSIKAKALDGTAPYRFAVYYRRAASKTWYIAQNFSTNSTISFNADQAGLYQIELRIKDADNRTTSFLQQVNVT